MTVHLFPVRGAKGLLAPRIMPALREFADQADRYIEPFIGSGPIGLRMASDFPSMRHTWNDLDPAIMAVWRDVRDQSEELIEKVRVFTPSVAAFREFKSPPPDGFRRLAFAYMTWSGNGSGCRGGNFQLYGRIDELWNPDRLTRKIELASSRLRRVGVDLRCENFAEVLADADDRTLIFLDPPYVASRNYYGCKFRADDHERLADLLGTTPARWCLTYDDHPMIRRLYRWARIDEIGHNNLLITPRSRDQRGCTSGRLTRLNGPGGVLA